MCFSVFAQSSPLQGFAKLLFDAPPWLCDQCKIASLVDFTQLAHQLPFHLHLLEHTSTRDGRQGFPHQEPRTLQLDLIGHPPEVDILDLDYGDDMVIVTDPLISEDAEGDDMFVSRAGAAKSMAPAASLDEEGRKIHVSFIHLFSDLKQKPQKREY